jgi:hypothetical protein
LGAAGTQLNATSGGVAETIVYTPAVGTVLTAGSQILSATFTPTDTIHYSSRTVTVPLTVTQALPGVTWATPAVITYGTALDSTELNASASVPGTFVYTPAAGTILAAGSQMLSVMFSPTDSVNYTNQAVSVVLTVNPAAPQIVWAMPAAISQGSALSSTQLNATTLNGVAGSYSYVPAAGTVLTTPGPQKVTVTFTPTNSNYKPVSQTQTLNVQVAPVLTWNPPAAISYGKTIYGAQLDATSNVPGTFVYNPASGTLLPAGQQTLSFTFTPTDTTSYTTATASVPLTVMQTNPVLTWNSPAPIAYGTALWAQQLNASASVPGTFVYTPPAGTVLPIGLQTLTATFTPNDPANYVSGGTVTTTVSVGQANPVITWPSPVAVPVGTALGATQLDATANVAGIFVYSPAAGTVLSASGTQTLNVSFAPTDTVHYAPVSATTTIAVTSNTSTTVKATPIITWAKPAAITAGAALSSAQLNATASVPGTFTYSPAAGAVLPAGTQALVATFTPTDSTHYNVAGGITTLTVNATPTAVKVTWNQPQAINYGTALWGAQLNATSNVAGTFAYSPASGTVLAPGTQTLSVTFTPTNTASAPQTVTVPLVVNQLVPVLKWATPAAITSGSSLWAMQLNASGSVPGTFTYSPAAGTVLTTGTYTLSATFTPTDTTHYSSGGVITTVSTVK